MNSHGWFPLGLAGLILLQSKELSVLQHHNSKASVLWLSAFFMVQLSHLYMTTGKTRALAIQTFVGKARSLLFNTLSGFVIAFLQRIKRFLISWLQSLYIGLFLLFLVHSPSFLFWPKEDLFWSKARGTAKYHVIGEFDSMGYHGYLNLVRVCSFIRPGWFYSKWEFMKGMLLPQYN